MDLSDPKLLAAAAQLTGIDLQQLPSDENRPLDPSEEYDLWKSNVPMMYDFVSETRLVWPSLTVQWLPHSAPNPVTRQELILGTHTSDEEQNYLKIAVVDLPTEVTDTSNLTESDEEQVRSNIRVTRKFKHDSEVTRARYMPQDPNILATISGTGTVYIYDRSNERDTASITLQYHTDNGYGLAFNPLIKGHLLSGSDDSNVALWDVTSDRNEPVQKWENIHSDIVNDCQWHNFQKSLFGTVSEDSSLQIHDTRESKPVATINGTKPFNTLSFSHHSENLLATGGVNSEVYLYDRRYVEEPLHLMSGHTDAVTSLDFSSQDDGIILSAGADKRVIIWDINDIGAEQVLEDAEDATSEVMMIHAGHRSPINDFAINPSIPWLVASAEEENIVQLWKCSHKLPRISGTPPVRVDMLQ
ncbi:Hat2p KNAG_0E00980 [Huiozyma naganishii CBS 8797]|uniref:Histone-binding protein RBBP4-like N-terminal domain-containing protein n=1 Tax=Huiozyma naganishii (strain ATCC MYA-139 / BCRC 22969 / CBS 8797 / KCTC 17520 / NBRC 10181 / NCYC 3082 / Yp74L-3) TaxID=1071383 RepID=J7S7J0_HUIN7|nr:hypothetical protein KNAG_0E00980 [Kazachstania naganishii CBS 8797]CCK70366.1 hypothetical protein KNAG_0E00980 [Kazachstania naganishii CBS 8797]